LKKTVIIGSGFAGLSAAAFMAKAGWDVTVLEKQSTPGGRARQLKAEGFTFDMGPSWYWMPDVFERYLVVLAKKFRIIMSWKDWTRLTVFTGMRDTQIYLPITKH
jgi:phytoene desaturase